MKIMNVRIIVFTVISILFIQVNVAYSMDGNRLYELYKKYDIDNNEKSCDELADTTFYIGFVYGTFLTYSRVPTMYEKYSKQIPWNKITSGQVCDIVGKWLKNNPKYRHKSATAIVLQALFDEYVDEDVLLLEK